ncbi:MAG: hypothetical protein WC565_08210 [Parcubacteria group bacterium]
MKDKEAREQIDALRKRVGSDPFYWKPVEDRVSTLEETVLALGARLVGVVERKCPTCGRVTLMKRQTGPVLEGTYILNDYSQSTVTMLPATPTFYCYGCGLTYRESTKQVLEEVKGG